MPESSRTTFEVRWTCALFGGDYKRQRVICTDLGSAHAMRACVRKARDQEDRGTRWLCETYGIDGTILSVDGIFQVTETRLE